MEVDLLCDAERVAVELDGGQHLGDAEAYRRDRRKDVHCKRTAISFSDSSQKTSALASTKSWTRFSGPSRIGVPHNTLDLNPPLNDVALS